MFCKEFGRKRFSTILGHFDEIVSIICPSHAEIEGT